MLSKMVQRFNSSIPQTELLGMNQKPAGGAALHTFPAHDAGDLIIMMTGQNDAYKDPCPDISGWTVMGAVDNANSGATLARQIKVFYKEDTDGTLTSITNSIQYITSFAIRSYDLSTISIGMTHDNTVTSAPKFDSFYPSTDITAGGLVFGGFYGGAPTTGRNTGNSQNPFSVYNGGGAAYGYPDTWSGTATRDYFLSSPSVQEVGYMVCIPNPA